MFLRLSWSCVVTHIPSPYRADDRTFEQAVVRGPVFRLAEKSGGSRVFGQGNAALNSQARFAAGYYLLLLYHPDFE